MQSTIKRQVFTHEPVISQSDALRSQPGDQCSEIKPAITQERSDVTATFFVRHPTQDKLITTQQELHPIQNLDDAEEQDGISQNEQEVNINEKAGLVFAPKRPLSPFIFFSQETRKKLKQEYPSLHSQKIVRIAIKRWNQLSLEEKKHYQELSQESRVQYQVQKDQFDSLQLNKRKEDNGEEETPEIVRSVKSRREAKAQQKAEMLQKKKDTELESAQSQGITKTRHRQNKASLSSKVSKTVSNLFGAEQNLTTQQFEPQQSYEPQNNLIRIAYAAQNQTSQLAAELQNYKNQVESQNQKKKILPSFMSQANPTQLLNQDPVKMADSFAKNQSTWSTIFNQGQQELKKNNLLHQSQQLNKQNNIEQFVFQNQHKYSNSSNYEFKPPSLVSKAPESIAFQMNSQLTPLQSQARQFHMKSYQLESLSLQQPLVRLLPDFRTLQQDSLNQLSFK